MALYEGLIEAIGIKRFILELGMKCKFIVHQDNQATIAMIKNQSISQRTRHIDIKYHWIREIFKDGMIDELKFCPTNDMIADCQTKALPKEKFLNFRYLMGIIEKNFDSNAMSSGSVETTYVSDSTTIKDSYNTILKSRGNKRFIEMDGHQELFK